MDSKKLLLNLAVYYNGDWDQIYNHISQKLEPPEDIDDSKLNYITILDDDYPLSLKHSLKPPFVLFYKGNINLLKRKNLIGVSGSREVSEYGKIACKTIVSKLTRDNIVIVSGLAKGIDTIAHLTTITRHGETIAVIGNGLDIVYPLDNKGLVDDILDHNGLILSEYPLGVQPAPEHFPMRDRIIAGISDLLIIPECKEKSGTLITVQYAVADGKDIYVVPHPIDDNTYNNELIKQGAYCITSGEDILENLNKEENYD